MSAKMSKKNKHVLAQRNVINFVEALNTPISALPELTLAIDDRSEPSRRCGQPTQQMYKTKKTRNEKKLTFCNLLFKQTVFLVAFITGAETVLNECRFISFIIYYSSGYRFECKRVEKLEENEHKQNEMKRVSVRRSFSFRSISVACEKRKKKKQLLKYVHPLLHSNQ